MCSDEDSDERWDCTVQQQEAATAAPDATPRIRQLMHGLRMAASDDLAPSDELESLGRLIQTRIRASQSNAACRHKRCASN